MDGMTDFSRIIVATHWRTNVSDLIDMTALDELRGNQYLTECGLSPGEQLFFARVLQQIHAHSSAVTKASPGQHVVSFAKPGTLAKLATFADEWARSRSALV